MRLLSLLCSLLLTPFPTIPLPYSFLLTPVMTFLSNLFSILRNFPAAISLIKALMDIIGSDAVKELFRIITDVAKSVKLEKPLPDDATPSEKTRFFQRLREKAGQRFLGLTDQQVAQARQPLQTAENTAGFMA